MNAALSVQNKNTAEAYIKKSLGHMISSYLHLVGKKRLLKKGLFSCPLHMSVESKVT